MLVRAPPLPDLQERMFEQWQRPRLASDVVEHGVDQSLFEAETDEVCRLFDHTSELRLLHRADEKLMARQDVGQFRVLGGLRHEIQAHREEDDRAPVRNGRRVAQVLDELHALGLARDRG